MYLNLLKLKRRFILLTHKKFIILLILFSCFFSSFINASIVISDEYQSNNITQDYIEDLFKKVFTENRISYNLDTSLFFNLPIGIVGGYKGDTIALLIDEVVLLPDKALFNASMLLTNPINGEKLAFAARNVEFSYKRGLVGTIRLELVSEKPLTLCKEINLQILKGSYVEWDCKGLKLIHLKGDFELSDDVYVRADYQGERLSGKVKSFFEVTASSLRDLVFNISLEPFQLKKFPDITFACNNISVDFSDISNPSTLRFPQGYQNVYNVGYLNLWKGVYIQNASVILNRKKFKNKKSNLPLSFNVRDLIIDESGFTGNFSIQNLLKLEDGVIGNWNISIDEFSICFVQSEIKSGGLKGKLRIPEVCDSTKYFTYSAIIDVDGNYFFTAGFSDVLDFKLFGNTKLYLYPSSYISIINDSLGFYCTAYLNGKMDINAPLKINETGSSELRLKNFEFQGLILSTKEPYIDIQYLAYNGSQQGDFANFPITINNIVFSKPADNEVKLSIAATINLKETSTEGFGGNTTISLYARRENWGYKYEGLKIDAVCVDFTKPGGYSIKGCVSFAGGDSIYGNGFKGLVKATFGDFKMEATGLFGNINGMRYFYVDALVAKKPTIIQAGIISIYGFCGGLYYRMRQSVDKNFYKSFGETSSGIVYKPDNTVSIGIKAGVMMSVVDESLVNANAGFEISFTKNEGINNIAFYGYAQCITSPITIDENAIKKLTENLISVNTIEPIKSALVAKLTMNKNFQNGVFHAEMEIFMNVAGVVKGTGSNNRAGWAVMHCDSARWYLHIGSPLNPIGISFLNLLSAKAYFMAGHDLPGTFAVNPKVANILGITSTEVLNDREKKLSDIEKGRGIAFGASFDFSTGDLTFLMFYGSFLLGAGFDINMIDYGPKSYCQGHSAPLGINGWYASGQAYAYVSGKIGIEAKVFKKKKKFEILSIAAATWLKVEGPNTFWMKGIVGGNYSVLGGLIKGNCRFEMEIGEKCEIRGANREVLLGDLQIIGDITPKDGSKEIDVFVTPQIVFNVPVESMQKISDDDGNIQYYRIKINNLVLKNITQNNNVQIYYDWNKEKTVVQIIPNNPLWATNNYELKVEISFEEYINNQWVPFKDENNKILTEQRVITFQTGLPDKISENIVACTYPINRQYNYMPYEYKYAYIKTLQNIEGFFVVKDKYDFKARWTTGNNSTLTNIMYNAGELTLYIEVPENMYKNSIYHLEIIMIPKKHAANIDNNVFSTETSIINDTSGTTAILKTRQAEGTVTLSCEKVLYSLYFKTSNYNNFKERFDKTNIKVRSLYDRGYEEFYLITELPGNEMFDIFERKGTGKISPLIQIEAILSNTPWFNDYVYPLTYDKYPWCGDEKILSRDTLKYGLMASKALSIWQISGYDELTDEEISLGYPLTNYSFCDIAYMSPYYWNEDFMEIRDYLGAKIVKCNESNNTGMCCAIINANSELIKQIMNKWKLRPVKPGEYPIKLKYVLPGKNEKTSEVIITLINEINTHEEDYK